MDIHYSMGPVSSVWLRRSGRVVALTALFFIAGGHWAALQTVAWTSMLWTYSQSDGSLLEAARKTFDGAHPCGLCDSIREAKKSEHSSPIAVAVKKIELLAFVAAVLLLRPRLRPFTHPPFFLLQWTARFAAPPAPVPIRFFSLA
jgi:hypothetical protein